MNAYRLSLLIAIVLYLPYFAVMQIPKGTKALGEEEPTLKEDFSFQFKTPIVKVRNSTEPSPWLFIPFAHDVDFTFTRFVCTPGHQLVPSDPCGQARRI